MTSINKFYDLLNTSKISLIGYTFKDERLKDELLSKISHIKVSDFDSSFNLKSLIRNSKIESLIGDNISSFNFVVIDISDLKFSIKTQNKRTYFGGSKSIENIAFQFYDSECKLIITSPVNKSLDSNGDDNTNYMGGNKSVYLSDVVFKLESDKIRIIKNRHDNFNEDIDLKENNYEYSK